MTITATRSEVRDLCEVLQAEFDLTLDVVAQPAEAMCAHILPQEGGVPELWVAPYHRASRCWLWPTTGPVLPWLKQAIEELGAGRAEVVVALLRLDPTASWWKHYVHPHAAELRILLGPRLTHHGKPLPAASAVAVYQKLKQGERRIGRFWDWRQRCREAVRTVGSACG